MPWRPKSHLQRRRARLKASGKLPARAPKVLPQMHTYGRRWGKLRRMQLRREPLCAACKARGRIVEAKVVHHVVAVRDGGEDALENLQSLCLSCHNRKTRREVLAREKGNG